MVGKVGVGAGHVDVSCSKLLASQVELVDELVEVVADVALYCQFAEVEADSVVQHVEQVVVQD